ncbi:MAG: hypothetical protein JWN34_121 [Bryobacterales bacterium]|nr:hypothetical protein [Bryobacterales bacterium]
MRIVAAILPLVFAVAASAQTADTSDPVKVLVSRLELQPYKETIRGLTKFGDRRQGTDRNRAAVDWIEAQLRSYGCAQIERLKYDYQPGTATRMPRNPPAPAKGQRGSTGVNSDPLKQPDEALRKLNEQPSTPGPREEVYCTKVGKTHPDEMYIVSAHMDGIGWGEAANDDGSGTALVMELARIFSSPEVETERSIRFILWNNEETGSNGAEAYVAQRKELQGKENPAGSGRYPEPRWLGIIQHDMLLFDHGMPGKDGKLPNEQRPEADVNIEFQSNSKMAAESATLAWTVQAANEKWATDYPATVGAHMSYTDSNRFQDVVASISLRESERNAHIGRGWDPHWHQPTDLFVNFTDADFKLGLNAAQTTLGAVAELAGASTRQ